MHASHYLAPPQVLHDIGILSRKGERMRWFRAAPKEPQRIIKWYGTEVQLDQFGCFDTSVRLA